jgi:hypothetical protein
MSPGKSRPPKSRALRGPLRRAESKLWKRHKDDFYIEPHWVSERLFQVELFGGEIWDPACGIGRIVEAARRAGHDAVGTDLKSRGFESFKGPSNFLKIKEANTVNIVCNPPFAHAEAFVAHALELATGKVAMLLPANWVQGDKRSRWLEKTPLRRVYFIAPRPSMPPGPVLLKGVNPGNGTTDYSWFVWLRGYDGHPEIRWLRRDDGVTSTHMGPEQKKRHTIKRRGKLKSANDLPLFKKRKDAPQ